MNDAILKTAGKALREQIKLRIIEQGHKLTGKIYQDIEERIERGDDSMALIGTLVHYARFVEYGVPADRIPFSPGSGRKTSMYIDALIRYAEARNMENPKSAAFAIAMKHKEEGMPTRASRRFSATGERLNFLQSAIKDKQADITDIIRQASGEVIKIAFHQMLQKTQKEWASV